LEVPNKSSKGCQVELLLDDSSEGVLNKEKLTINLREAYVNYFRLRDSNVEGRTDVFNSLYTQARQLDLERRKLQAEVDVLRLKDQNNAGTLQDLEGMFRGSEGNQELR
jgi:hypothetical protein